MRQWTGTEGRGRRGEGENQAEPARGGGGDVISAQNEISIPAAQQWRLDLWVNSSLSPSLFIDDPEFRRAGSD